MDIQFMKEEISHLADAVNEQVEIILRHESKIPQIELDLILENIRELYEIFHELNKENSKLPSILGSKFTEPEPEHSRNQIPPAPEEVNIPVNVPVTFHVPEPVPIPVPDPVIIPEPEPEVSSETIHMIGKKDPPSSDLFSGAHGSTIADKFKDEKISINEKLSVETEDKSINTRIHQSQISDLKTVIGINEKFQFINELFEGNMQDYTMAINQLNLFRNKDEALEFIDILKMRFHWDIASDAYKKLLGIVNRRYM